MEDKVKIFLESGLLEEYMMGLTSDADTLKVEQFIQEHPKVREAYEQLQEDVEAFANKYRKSMPQDLKEKILHNVGGKPKPLANVWSRITTVLTVMTMVLFGSTLMLYYQTLDLEQQKNTVDAEFAILKRTCDERQNAFAALEKEHAILSHHLTQKVNLEGSGMAEGLAATAYWNNKAQASFMNVRELPEPPKAHCYQLWADVDGEMVDMGVIAQNKGSLLNLPFKTNATSLNITIEPTGGSDHPTVSRLVASAVL